MAATSPDFLPEQAGLVLIGYRATGKTTVGRLLAGRLGRPFLDADEELERRLGRRIAQIFADEGEVGFRQHEADVIRDICRDQPGIVLATGGGAVLDGSTRSILRDFGRVIWLAAPVDVIVRRLEQDHGGRPSLTGRGLLEEVDSVLRQRESAYRECSHVVADASADGPDRVVEDVLASLARAKDRT